jgi:hypothetical protein
MKRCVVIFVFLFMFAHNAFAVDFVRSFKKQVNSANQPALSLSTQQGVLAAEQFAKQAVLALYTLGNQAQRNGLSHDLKRAAHYFSPAAWEQYRQDFRRSGNEAMIERDGLLVTARLDGSPKTIDVVRDAHAIRSVEVNLPFVATYRAYDYKVRQFLKATVRVLVTHDGQESSHQIVMLKLARTQAEDEKTTYDRSKPGCPLDDRH